MKKKKDEEFIKSQANSMIKFVTRPGTSKIDEALKDEINDNEIETGAWKNGEKEVHIDEQYESVDGEENMEETDDENPEDINNKHGNVNINDLGNWKIIDKGMIDFFLLERVLRPD